MGEQTRRTAARGVRRVAAVVPAHNAAKTLPACLRALAASRRAPAVVCVVDDASETAVTASAGSAAGFPAEADVRVIRTGDRPVGPGRARNLAVAGLPAAIDTVWFVDSDVVVHPEALGWLLAAMDEGETRVAAFGSYDDTPPAPAVASLYANLRHHQTHQDAPREAVTFWAGCGVVDRSAFDAAGGYAAAYARPSIEDIELGERLTAAGGTVVLERRALSTHLKAWTLGGLWRTDVLARAIPWSRLLTERPPGAAPLNARPAERVAALGAAGVWGAPLVAWVGGTLGGWPAALGLAGGVAVLGLLLVAALNRRLLAKLRRAGGLRALLGGLLLHTVYYGYASLIFAAFVVRKRWRVRGPSGAAGCLVTAGLLLLAAGVAGGCLLLAGLPAGVTEDVWRAMVPGRVDPGVLTQARARAGWLALGYGALAGLLLVAGARPAAQAFGSAGKLLRGLRRRLEWIDAVVVLGLSVGLAGVAWRYLGQPLRTDEATSWLNYGVKPLPRALLVYENTNNHVLNSALMSLGRWLGAEAPWGARLPAFGATLLCVPAAGLAGAAWGGRRLAWLAAAIFAGLPYTVDVATNGRGYPLMMLALLLMLALTPRMRRGDAGAVTLGAAVAALGAWAVPVMLYGFAWVALVVGWGRRRALVRLVATTGALTVAAYGVLGLVSGLGAAGDGMSRTLGETLERLGPAERVAELARNVGVAARLWLMPAADTAGWLAAGAAGVALTGIGWAAWRRGRGRALVLAAGAGPLAVWGVTGLAPLPWWSMGWAYVMGVLALAAGLAAVLRRAPLGNGGFAVASLAIAAAGWTTTWRSGYPDPASVPAYVGLDHAAVVARTIAGGRSPGSVVLCEPVAYPVLKTWPAWGGADALPAWVARVDAWPLPGVREVWLPRAGARTAAAVRERLRDDGWTVRAAAATLEVWAAPGGGSRRDRADGRSAP